MKGKTYKLKGRVWLYPGIAGWHFVSVNKKISKEIKQLFGWGSRGFGSLPVMVTVGVSKWKTSIFPDKKSQTYILPLKALIRKKENIIANKIVIYSIEILI